MTTSFCDFTRELEKPLDTINSLLTHPPCASESFIAWVERFLRAVVPEQRHIAQTASLGLGS
jgi:hypothetical protein